MNNPQFKFTVVQLNHRGPEEDARVYAEFLQKLCRIPESSVLSCVAYASNSNGCMEETVVPEVTESAFFEIFQKAQELNLSVTAMYRGHPVIFALTNGVVFAAGYDEAPASIKEMLDTICSQSAA